MIKFLLKLCALTLLATTVIGFTLDLAHYLQGNGETIATTFLPFVASKSTLFSNWILSFLLSAFFFIISWKSKKKFYQPTY